MVKRSIRIAKDGWEEGVGWGSGAHDPSPGVIESGSLSSKDKTDGVERKEVSSP